MPYDLNRCPQTEAEFLDYFYTLIGRKLDGNANDWFSVLSAQYVWKGQLLTIPPGVGPGVKQTADAPFFGLTQQWSSGPKARIFLPTNAPDGNGYYTRNIQYIKDTPGGVHGTDFTWTWWYMDGNAYAPVTGVDDGTTPIPPPTDDLEKRVAILEVQMIRGSKRIEELQGQVSDLDKRVVEQSDLLRKLEAKMNRLTIEGKTASARAILSHDHGVGSLKIVDPLRQQVTDGK